MTPITITDSDTETYNVEDNHVAHLAGVFDAIGNIRLQVQKRSSYRLGYMIRPVLRLERPQESDPLLGKLAAYSDEYNVRYSFTERSGSSIKWTVTDTESVRNFLEPMMEYLVSKHTQANLMLRQALPAIEQEKHKTKEGFVELMGIADKMRLETPTRGSVKYTQEYFKDKWSLSE